jgi:hypothetical protein
VKLVQVLRKSVENTSLWVLRRFIHRARIYFSYPKRCMEPIIYPVTYFSGHAQRFRGTDPRTMRQAVAAKDSDQLSPILSELRDALHE